MKRTIAIDIDDVLADSTEALRLVVNEKYGADLKPEHYLEPGEYHKYYDGVWERNGIADIVSKDELNSQMVADQSHVRPHADVLSVLKELAGKYELVVITARNPTWEKATHVWLQLHFPDVFKKVIFVGQHEDATLQTKGDLCTEVGAHWLIDDNVTHCQSALDNGVEAILFGEYGWHQGIPDRITPCKDWQAVLEYFNARTA
jgi:5'(3')-deoxyribonucleotidase